MPNHWKDESTALDKGVVVTLWVVNEDGGWATKGGS